MPESTLLSPEWIETYALSESPDARELAVLEAQSKRVAAMLQDGPGPAGSMFAIEPWAFAALLARLADEDAA